MEAFDFLIFTCTCQLALAMISCRPVCYEIIVIGVLAGDVVDSVSYG